MYPDMEQRAITLFYGFVQPGESLILGAQTYVKCGEVCRRDVLLFSSRVQLAKDLFGDDSDCLVIACCRINLSQSGGQLRIPLRRQGLLLRGDGFLISPTPFVGVGEESLTKE